MQAHNSFLMRLFLFLFFLLGFSPIAFAAREIPSQVTLSVVGTSDLHGHIAVLPWLAGYLKNLRAARADGAVIVLDAGDMFQGTLESNLQEGASVIRAYNTLGYSAVVLGNHEFDFGPAGPAPTPTKPSDDPRGALKVRAMEARFPFLAANVIDKNTRKPVAWPNFKPSIIVEAAGIKVGIVGVVSASTSRTSLAANVADLDFLPLAPTIASEAHRLRNRGAKLVIAVAHEGGGCKSFDDPDNLDSCDVTSEIFSIAHKLPKGSVDVILAGHTHQAIAQRVANVPILQAYSNGQAFSRVDLTVERTTGKILTIHILPPQEICPVSTPEVCMPGDYEGSAVSRDEKVADLNALAFLEARRKGEERLGVEILHPLPHNRNKETALGNLFADLMRTGRPGTDVALMNGGGIRTALPAGPLTYGRLYETFPFDNAFAWMRLAAGEFRTLLARSLTRSHSLFTLSGMRVLARCKDNALDVTLIRPNGSTVQDDEMLTLATTDFLATGGDGFFAGSSITFEIGPIIRDILAEALRNRRGSLDPDNRSLFDTSHPRFDLPTQVPIHCDK